MKTRIVLIVKDETLANRPWTAYCVKCTANVRVQTHASAIRWGAAHAENSHAGHVVLNRNLRDGVHRPAVDTAPGEIVEEQA